VGKGKNCNFEEDTGNNRGGEGRKKRASGPQDQSVERGNCRPIQEKTILQKYQGKEPVRLIEEKTKRDFSRAKSTG